MKPFISCLLILTSMYISAQHNGMMIRLSEITVDSCCLQDYNHILQIESRASVQKESGVICIFPMYQKENPFQIRILEIYADQAAYENHIKSPHFMEYKTSTLKMVKALKLIDMHSIDPETISEIFRKLKFSSSE